MTDTDDHRRRCPVARPPATTASSSPPPPPPWPSTPAPCSAQGFRLALVAAHDDRRHATRASTSTSPPAPDRRVELHLPIDRDRPTVPTLAAPVLPRRPLRTRDARPVRHRARSTTHCPAAWSATRTGPPAGTRCAATPAHRRRSPTTDGPFPFLTVEGPGVYEIPVGPVHAGLIEPGHFRFSVVGETILKLKARLWYVHKGIEKLFEHRRPAAGLRARRTHQRRHRRRPRPGLLPAPSKTPCTCTSPPKPTGSARSCSNWNASTTTSPTSAPSATTSATASSTPTRCASAKPCCASTRTPPGTGCCAAASSSAAPPCAASPTPPTSPRSAPTSATSSRLALDNSLVAERFTGTAILTPQQARDLGTLGYVARASGLSIDARRDHPTDARTDDGRNRRLSPSPPTPPATSWPASNNAPPKSTPPSPSWTPCSAPSHPAPSAAGPPPTTSPPPARRIRRRHRRRLARHHRPPRRTRPRPPTHPGQDRRPVLLQLARPARRPHRHDRPRLPARQQKLQPLLRRQRPVTGRTPGTTKTPPPRQRQPVSSRTEPPRWPATFCHQPEVVPAGPHPRIARGAVAHTRPGSILTAHDGFDNRGATGVRRSPRSTRSVIS